MQAAFDWDEVCILIALLNAKGVCYLVGDGVSLRAEEKNIDAITLIQRLAACGYPLVESAAISLFILHPELASSVVDALRSSEQEVAENIAVVTLATLYLQQWWFFRLSFVLGQLPSFPAEPFAALWEERHLPPPSQGYGLDGLLALQEYQQQRYGLPLNFLWDWQNQLNHLLTQEGAYRRRLPDALVQVLRQISITNVARYEMKEQTA